MFFIFHTVNLHLNPNTKYVPWQQITAPILLIYLIEEIENLIKSLISLKWALNQIPDLIIRTQKQVLFCNLSSRIPSKLLCCYICLKQFQPLFGVYTPCLLQAQRDNDLVLHYKLFFIFHNFALILIVCNCQRVTVWFTQSDFFGLYGVLTTALTSRV